MFKKMEKKTRFNLDLSPEMSDRIGRLAVDIDGNKSDVLRLAVVFLEKAVAMQKRGMYIGAATNRDSLTTEFIGLWAGRSERVKEEEK